MKASRKKQTFSIKKNTATKNNDDMVLERKIKKQLDQRSEP